MNLTKRSAILLLLAATLSANCIPPAIADDDDRDHEIARKALSEGKIRPLAEIMDELKSEFPGQVVGVELETKTIDTFIYEFKVLTPDGKLKEVKVDATTAKILKIKDDD